MTFEIEYSKSFDDAHSDERKDSDHVKLTPEDEAAIEDAIAQSERAAKRRKVGKKVNRSAVGKKVKRTSPSKIVGKKVKRKSAFPLLKSGNYIRDFSEMIKSPFNRTVAEALVGKEHLLSLTNPTHRHYRAHPFVSGYGTSFKKLAPPRWRELDDAARLIPAYIAMRQMGQVWKADVNLRHDIAEQAIGKGPKCCDWLRRRVVDYLKKALGRDVSLFMVLEDVTDNEDRRLHFHALMVITYAERIAVRKALRQAAGEWEFDRQFQVRLRMNPSIRRAGYIVKNAYRARPGFRKWMARVGEKRWPATFQGPATSMTQDVGRAAKDAHAKILGVLKAAYLP